MISLLVSALFVLQLFASADSSRALQIGLNATFRKRINFISPTEKRVSNVVGWEAYDGSVYTPERGYGWVTKPTGLYGSNNGEDAAVRLPKGIMTSPSELRRLELANSQGVHQENKPLVFRIDVPNGWYRIRCASVAHIVLPVVDQTSFKCRAHDSVFVGPQYGRPLKASGLELLQGSNIAEATSGHLRVVIGDPAYGGWTWAYQGPWYQGWSTWWGEWGDYRYAATWYDKFTRVIDPGFHSLRINSLEVERVAAPAKRPVVIFRDFFNRDDNSDINSEAAEDQWIKVKLNPAFVEPIDIDLYKTSLRFAAPPKGNALLGVVQKKTSPEKGVIRYSTRVSLFTGEGSKIGSGFQEAGLLILGDPRGVTEYNSTFIGVAFDRRRAGTPGSVRYRIGNGQNGYRTNSEIPDSSLPFRVTEGEYEIIVDHDVKNDLLKRIQINGQDLTAAFRDIDRKPGKPSGVFGIRTAMDPLNSGVTLRQFYWYYRVEDITRMEPLVSE